ncbi:MAG TPA: arsenate reductase ArsC [Jatrophihabitans sp.]|nr:arsenate reductase ArsC [Jatrophihabitans sp.]
MSGPGSDHGEGRPDGRPSVLFVCVHNAGRSQMAAGWLRYLAGDRIEIRSAGSEPADQLNPVAVQAMAEVGIDIGGEHPKLLTADVVSRADAVITMGCGDNCPYYPGKRYEDWPLTDPAGQPIDVVRQVRDDIHDRVQQLVAGLLAESSDRPAPAP